MLTQFDLRANGRESWHHRQHFEGGQKKTAHSKVNVSTVDKEAIDLATKDPISVPHIVFQICVITRQTFWALVWGVWLIYTTCMFIYVWYGPEYNFPHCSPTLSGLMLVLSVPVLTRSPSRLQFLLAIATRLPFWPGPADLKTQGKHCLAWIRPSNTTQIFKMCPDHVLLKNRRSHECPHNKTSAKSFLLTDVYRAAALVGDYLRRCFCRWCRFLLLVCSGRPVFSSSPLLLGPLWPNTGWRWSRPHGNRQHWSCTYYRNNRQYGNTLAFFVNSASRNIKRSSGVPQILAIVIGGHIVDMNLVAFLENIFQKLLMIWGGLFCGQSSTPHVLKVTFH